MAYPKSYGTFITNLRKCVLGSIACNNNNNNFNFDHPSKLPSTYA